MPNVPRFVIIVAPHTSNWDFVVGSAAKLALGLDASWIGKQTIFRWPVAGLLRRFGGIPVDRSAPHDVVGRVVAEFTAREQMVFALAPEGTRRRVDEWRSGYWHIAHRAGVPIVPVGFDYGDRRIVIGPPVTTTDDLAGDERALRTFFAGITPRTPALYAP